ncbi:hypothetical protein B5P24_08630 [Clavibacter tessellarius]|uniref:Uncharacterized protein n=3 Tax=Clavibacter tessellarius TaxID=31965 RepID=A0A225CMS9_9MICO|nr:hypothetical protein B5P24_08630 [Clavibacter michiganensis subsp. tessellarius]
MDGLGPLFSRPSRTADIGDHDEWKSYDMDASAEVVGIASESAARVKRRRSRALAALSVTAGVALASVTGASSAQAVGPAFEIFYGPDCSGGGTASRVYTGINQGEAWIDDTFDKTTWGSTGSGQLIRNNAASIYVSHANVALYLDGSSYIGWDAQASGACFNLTDGIRNHNTRWKTASYYGS